MERDVSKGAGRWPSGVGVCVAHEVTFGAPLSPVAHVFSLEQAEGVAGDGIQDLVADAHLRLEALPTPPAG